MSPRRTAVVRLATIARQQFGVFTRAQAIESGIPSSTLAEWLRAGRYRRLLPGVLVGAEVPDSWNVRAMAAVLAVGPPVVLARQSAARLLGMDVPPSLPDGLALLVRNRTFPTLPTGITVHRTRRLPDHHVVRVGRFSATSPGRTIGDLAGQVGLIALRRSSAHAVRTDLTDDLELRSVAGALGRFRGKRNLLRVCDELSPLEEQCRSELESRFLQVVTQAGIPPTAMNHPVVDADGRQRYIDAVYLPHMVGVELDSKLAHGSRIDRNDDRDRERAIVATGWPPFVHANWSDVVDRPRHLVETIRARLSAAEATLFLD